MKKLLIIPTLLLSLTLSAQTKLLDTTKIKLTPSQVLAISLKVDSLQMLLSATSSLPSNQITAFNQRVLATFAVMWMQVRQQSVKVDTAKKGK